MSSKDLKGGILFVPDLWGGPSICLLSKLNELRRADSMKRKRNCLFTTLYCYCSHFYAFLKDLFNLIVIWSKFCGAWSRLSLSMIGNDCLIAVKNMNMWLRVPASSLIIVRIQDLVFCRTHIFKGRPYLI